MLLIRNVKIPLDSDFSDLKNLFLKNIKIDSKLINDVKLYKKSIDARKKDNIYFICSFIIKSDNKSAVKKALKKYDISDYSEIKYVYKSAKSDIRPVVVGFGPAGMFAAYSLAKAGLKPIVIEQGKDVDSRKNDVFNFFNGGRLIEHSNIQFGEGGAGTFSDGKLNTGIKDFRTREVLQVFTCHGAPENILYDSKPHIGTDVLINVVKSIRNEIISLGGEIRFENKLIDFNFKNNNLCSIKVKSNKEEYYLNCSHLVLSIGHSARDTFTLLRDKQVTMQPKAFAIGVRIEHKQEMINKSQYGGFYNHPSLGAADYKLYTHLKNGRGVFTFCMCPGGEIVNASSEFGGVVTNGMSNSERNGEFANSAILVNVNVDDYYINDVLDGMHFQREIEQKAYKIGNGRTIIQTIQDFNNNEISKKNLNTNSTTKRSSNYENINKIFPDFINESLKEGIKIFENKLKGFSDKSATLTAPETRSSSPIRILRNETGNSSIIGIYPCGEGAGYAGGITSAAVDGLKIAEMIINDINNKTI